MEGTLLVTPAELKTTASTFQGKAGDLWSRYKQVCICCG